MSRFQGAGELSLRSEKTKMKKEEMLQEIANLFFEKGYDKASIRDISKILGMSNPGLYYYFQNKQEMLFEIVDDLMERTLDNLREKISTVQDPEEKLLQIIRSHIGFFVKYKAQAKVLAHEVNSLEGKYGEITKGKQREYAKVVRDTLNNIMKESGSEIDVNVATFCLFGMLNSIYQWYDPRGNVCAEVLSGNILKFILNGLKANSF